MGQITITGKKKTLPFLPREVVFMGSDQDIHALMNELKFWGPLSKKVKALLNFREIDAILQQIQAEK